jgi:histidyl-tRNA synthetase
LPDAERLLSRYEVPSEALEELREVLGLLALHDLPNVTIELAPGMARGIAYYSGLIFELYADTVPNDPAQTPLCGGGRYDGLALALTGTHSFPALGFSFAVEVLQAAAVGLQPQEAAAIVVLVRREDQRRGAYQIADSLRSRGLSATVHEMTERADESTLQTPEAFGAAALLAFPDAGDQRRMPTMLFGKGEESPYLLDLLHEACASVVTEDRAPIGAGDRA